MTFEQTVELYASVLRQLLPVGGYDNAQDTVIAIDINAHAKVLAQADMDAKRLLSFIEGIPVELLDEYEQSLGLPLKCTVNGSKPLKKDYRLFNGFKRLKRA